MINFNAYVIELEEDTWYKVSIEDMCTTTVRDNGYFDDTVLFVPSASADMRGVDVSNWQCDIDTYALDADFVVAGATWGVGGFNNMCLTNGVNQAANYQLGRAADSGKSIGVYHYAMGHDANAEADITFESALATVIEFSLSNDYDYVETERCLTKTGRRCRKYVISVDNGD